MHFRIMLSVTLTFEPVTSNFINAIMDLVTVISFIKIRPRIPEMGNYVPNFTEVGNLSDTPTSGL